MQTILILWLVLTTFGQIGLLVLLGTLGISRNLAQGRNPYFMNFLAVSFLKTFPPGLLWVICLSL